MCRFISWGQQVTWVLHWLLDCSVEAYPCLSSDCVLPVCPSAGLSEFPSVQRRSHTPISPSRRPETARTRTPLPDASPAPRWWSGRPSARRTSSIWQRAPGKPTEMFRRMVGARGLVVVLLLSEVAADRNSQRGFSPGAIFRAVQNDYRTNALWCSSGSCKETVWDYEHKWAVTIKREH